MQVRVLSPPPLLNFDPQTTMQHLLPILASTLLLTNFSTFAAIRESRTLERNSFCATGLQERQGDSEALFRSAVTLYRQQHYEEALAKSVAASTLNPGDYRPRALIGYIYLAQHKLKSASEAFTEAIRLQPQMKELYLAKAQADMLRNARAEAIAACRKATEVDTKYAEAYAMLGDLLQYEPTQRADAINALQTAIKLKPELSKSYDTLGNILVAAKDEKGAEEVFRQGMAADPKKMAGRFALGRLMVRQGRLTEARKLWEDRSSDEDRTYPQFIELLQRAENLKRATDGLAQKPNDPDALVDMGMAVMDGDHWVVDGRQRRALVYFRKALELKPNFARAQYGICKAFIQAIEFLKEEKTTLDQELAKLRKLDPALAAELDEYRKTYSPGIRAVPTKVDQ